jgi:hypothetical protein
MAKKIPLTRGQYALIDAEDYALVSRYNWRRYQNYKSGIEYAASFLKPRDTPLLMHRLILDAPSGMQVDHINGNGLDNRRKNLRLATRTQNMWNRRRYRNNTSGFKGVVWHKRDERWQARINVNRRRIYLGLFDSKEEAAHAYDHAANKYHGEFARLNFPEGGRR